MLKWPHCDVIAFFFRAKTLEELELKKEWQLSYDVLPEGTKNSNEEKTVIEKPKSSTYKHRVAVYTCQTNSDHNATKIR